MSNYDFDYFVIGGGSGGVRSARIAASHGARVGLAEGQYYGGTCVNVGCVPKKLFAYAADFGHMFEDARGFGWHSQRPDFDWQTLLENKNAEIERLNGIYKNLLDKAGVKRFDAFAKFINAHTLQVGDKQITADKILIATGGTPRRPDFEGAQHAHISDDAFYMESFPKSVIIQGGGYIAVEFARIFHGLGAKVKIIYRGECILCHFDSDIGPFLTNEMRKQGVEIIAHNDITKIEKTGNRFKVEFTNHTRLETDLVFSAIGRVPNTKSLELDKAGVELDEKGFVKVNDRYESSVANIYAVGDVTATMQLTPVALAEGHALADRLFNKQDRKVEYTYLPTAVFSSPPCASCGLSEQEARAKGLDIEIYKANFKPMMHTLSGRDERTFMKLIVNKKDDKVIGAHFCGKDTPEMMQAVGVAMNAGATKADFDRTIGIHPTSAEEFVTMRTPV